MAIQIKYEGNDILEDRLKEFSVFVSAIGKLCKTADDKFLGNLNFDGLGKPNFFHDLVLDSIARNIAVPKIAGCDVRIASSEEYSCGVNIWTRKLRAQAEQQYGLESNIYVLSFPIGIKDHRDIKLQDPELFYSNIRQPISAEYVRAIRIMRFFEQINDYQSAIGNVQEGIKRVSAAYESLKKELAATKQQ